MRAAVRKVAAEYECRLDQVEICFEESDGAKWTAGDTWTITVRTPSPDRRKRDDETSVHADTLEEAVEKSIDYRKWHRER